MKKQASRFSTQLVDHFHDQKNGKVIMVRMIR